MDFRLIIIWASITLAVGCGESSHNTPVKVEADPLESKQKAEEEGLTYYLVPTPNELFGLIEKHVALDQNEALNPPANRTRYIDANSRALNFGVYATDLIYVSRAQQSVEVARYFITVKKMAEEMGIAAAFDDRVFLNLETDVATGDSLNLISLEAYYRAYDALEKNDKGPELGLLVTGGWIESMHLSMLASDTFGANGELEQRIAEQKYTLDNLIDLNGQYDSSGSREAVQMLEKIRSIYDAMEMEKVPADRSTASGRMVLGDRNNVKMSEEQYLLLKNTISDTRASITKTEKTDLDG